MINSRDLSLQSLHMCTLGSVIQLYVESIDIGLNLKHLVAGYSTSMMNVTLLGQEALPPRR